MESNKLEAKEVDGGDFLLAKNTTACPFTDRKGTTKKK